METQTFPPNVGPLATLSEQEKKLRLDTMVRLWQRESEERIRRDGVASMLPARGLDDYRYLVWLRFPEWERTVVVSQVIALRNVNFFTPPATDMPEIAPLLFSHWRHEPLLRHMADWKLHLAAETVFNICVLLTPSGLGEGARWAIVMPRTMVSRYRAAWPTQSEWVHWTERFDWLAVAVPSIRTMLREL